jgi:hypothetical protein
MFERDYAVRHRKGAFDISRLSQGFIVIQKRVSISRRSRSRNWIIAHSSPVCVTLPTDVIQMPASAITRQPQVTRSRAPRRAVRRKELAAQCATTDPKHRTRRTRSKRKTYADSRTTGSRMGLISVFENHARLRDAARAFVGFRDRRADGRTLHVKACCEREATGRARERAKGKPCFCTRQHPGHKGQDRMGVCAIQVSYEAPDQDFPLVRASYGSRLHLTITRPSAFAAKKSNQPPADRATEPPVP